MSIVVLRGSRLLNVMSIHFHRTFQNAIHDTITKKYSLTPIDFMILSKTGLNYKFKMVRGFEKNDLFKAENTLLDIIKEMDIVMSNSFNETFKLIEIEFKNVFKEMFNGVSK